MKILLTCPPLSLYNLEYNQQAIAQSIQRGEAQGADLVLLGEASLSGFEALNFQYKEDIHTALALRSPEIAYLQAVCRKSRTGVGFGFYENDGGGIYSSYLILDGGGDIVDRYHRVSPHWKVPEACADYREGKTFHTFTYRGWSFSTLICGDLWEDECLDAIIDLDDRVDAFLWPVHVDFSVREWQQDSGADRISKQDYLQRAAILAKPVLFVNNFIPQEGRAQGGLYCWEKGRERQALPMGQTGDLLITF